MFFFRNDSRFLVRARRRVRSTRGAAYAEFAFVAPLLALVISAMIELTGFWDAQVMANHTAWTVGRIATVRPNIYTPNAQGQIVDMPSYVRTAFSALTGGSPNFAHRGSIATMFLMSTCGIGYFGGTAGTSVTDLLKNLITAPIRALQDKLPGYLAKIVTETIIPKIPISDEGIMKKIAEKLNELLGSAIQAAVTPICNALCSAFSALIDKVLPADVIDEVVGGNRVARELVGAANRMRKASDVIAITPYSRTPMVFGHVAPFNTPIGYPLCLDGKEKSDEFFVESATEWPPKSQPQRMVKVTVSWPFEMGWLFPVVSGFSPAAESSIRAKGHSLVYPQPGISNDNLKSSGATPYDPGEWEGIDTKVIEDCQNKIKKYIQLCEFAYAYRKTEENIGPWEHDRGALKRSDKGFTPMVDLMNGGKPGDENGGEYHGDYVKCWDALTDNAGWRDKFWKDLLEKHETDLRKKVRDSDRYRAREWYYFDGGPHRRYWNYKGERYAVQNKAIQDYKQDSRDCSPSEGRHEGYKDGRYRECFCSTASAPTDWNTFCPVHITEDGLVYKGVSYRKAFALDFPAKVQTILRCCDNGAARIRRETEACDKIVKFDGYWKTIKTMIDKNHQTLTQMSTGETPSAEDGTMDFGLNTEEAMKDPQAAAKNAEKKLEELKQKASAKLLELDAKIKEHKEKMAELDGLMTTARRRRDAALWRMHENFERHWNEQGGWDYSTWNKDEGKFAFIALADGIDCNAIIADSDKIAELGTRCDTLLHEIFDLERDYGALFGGAGSREVGDKGLDDIPYDPEHSEPETPQPSSPTSGSDDDGAGEEWVHGEGGWRKAS